MKILIQSSIFFIFLFLGPSYQEERHDRSFSLFNVVKFKNTGCQATSSASLQGVCHTKQECTDGGGMADGNCAAGFGTCCIFIVSGTTTNCGGTVTRNCSYIQNPEFPASRTAVGNCAFPVNRCSSEICQIRLDFKSPTSLAQPTTTTGVCTESLVVTPGATTTSTGAIPTLCGTLTGQHMYIDAGNANVLAATLTFATVTGSTTMWRVKVSQIECSSSSRAPNGCLQYFTGQRNTVTSYNFDGTAACVTGCQLANQDYNNCFRTEAGMCGINYTPSNVATGSNAFQLGGMANIITAQQGMENCAQTFAGNANTLCLNAAADTCSFIQIPGSNSLAGVTDLYCGMFLNSGTNAGTGATTNELVTSNLRPFRFRYAVLGNSAALGGYSLDVSQTPC